MKGVVKMEPSKLTRSLSRLVLLVVLCFSAMTLALSMITEPGDKMLSLYGSADHWGLAIGVFGVAIGIGLGLGVRWLLLTGCLGCALWYFAILLLLAEEANRSTRSWSIPVLAGTLAVVYTVAGILHLPQFEEADDAK